MHSILTFNDISGLGNCSLMANAPIFTKLGHYVMPVVTANFSCNTAFSNYVCSPNLQVEQSANSIVANRKPTAVYVGWCNSVATLEQVARCVTALSDVFVFVDPIMGDKGKLYGCFDQSYVTAMRALLPLADVITPNLTEACLLANVNYDDVISHQNQPAFLGYCGQIFADFLTKTGAKSAVITGIECGELMGNVVLTDNGLSYVTNNRAQGFFSGTGDVFSSVVTGQMLNGYTLLQATQVASNFVLKSLQASACQDGRFGLEYMRVLNLL